jgi:hypothetical protein
MRKQKREIGFVGFRQAECDRLGGAQNSPPVCAAARMGAFQTPFASLDWSLPAISRLLRDCFRIASLRSWLECGRLVDDWVGNQFEPYSTTLSQMMSLLD